MERTLECCIDENVNAAIAVLRNSAVRNLIFSAVGKLFDSGETARDNDNASLYILKLNMC